MTWKDYLLLFGVYFFGWFIGFLSTRSALKTKYSTESKGTIRIAYDPDDPTHPVMGLVIDSLEYILNTDRIVLTVEKKGFPSAKGPIVMEAKKPDRSA